VRLERGLEWDQIAFLGDDVHDLGLLGAVGLAACPADAMPVVQAAVHLRCRTRGGFGAFRELADLVVAGART
jgi:3-deoxy-D-manno-octulosonate 8-phosphate phosphatase (KDO 8-P phosphatase)